jgi:hypothetical protein
MNRSYLLFSVLFSAFLTSCDPSSKQEISSGKEVQFEFLDSIVVESLLDLHLAAKNEENGNLIFKERFLKEFLLTDSKGEILNTLELMGEGPNQVSFPMEMAFIGDHFVVKEISAEMKLNLFDSEFSKQKMSPALASGLNMVEISINRRTFQGLSAGNQDLILGTESNAVESQWMTPENQKPEFYHHAQTGYIYNPATDSVTRFNLYPENWQPKKDKEWVGQAMPYVSALGKENLIAVLPRIGDQLFFYEWNGQNLVSKIEVKLSHPERNSSLKVDPMEQAFLYPAFSDIKGGGNYFLIEFHTEVPLQVFQEWRAKSEDYMRDPEFKLVLEKYRNAKYILVDQQGNQGIVSSLPIEGQTHYMDSDDVIYIKPESKEEKDYNVFYRYKVKM